MSIGQWAPGSHEQDDVDMSSEYMSGVESIVWGVVVLPSILPPFLVIFSKFLRASSRVLTLRVSLTYPPVAIVISSVGGV